MGSSEWSGGEMEQARSLCKEAGLLAERGDLRGAMDLWEQALELQRQSGDVHGRAFTLSAMANVIAQQGDISRALPFWQQAIELFEQAGDTGNRAATLSLMARLTAGQEAPPHAAGPRPPSEAEREAATLQAYAQTLMQQGQASSALDCWQQALALLQSAGELRGQPLLLNDMAIATARYVNVSRALELWQQALALCDQLGAFQDKGLILHVMGGVLARQGDTGRAIELWAQAESALKQAGDLRGPAVARNSMAMLISQEGDRSRALGLFQRSLKLRELIDDVQGKAAVLHNMAVLTAQQGDISQALRLWQESLEIKERTGDIQGRATTLNTMAWAALELGDRARSRELNLEAAKTMASIHAWSDLVTILSLLAEPGSPDAVCYLAQALWLSTRLAGVPAQQVLELTEALIREITPDSDLAPLLATTANVLVWERGRVNPRHAELSEKARALLAACGKARKLEGEQLLQWIKLQGLTDPKHTLSATLKGLERLIGERGWLFVWIRFER
jgi:tetratricopeptide (TPR) repeat protein